MAKYRLVQLLSDGTWDVTDLTGDNVVPALSVRGFEIDEGRVGGHHLREELRGQPVFKDLSGPMWGGIDETTGEAIIRYETWKAYERLSA